MPRASKPSRDVDAFAQSLPVAENQADEPALRVPVEPPLHKPMMANPPSQDVTALRV